MTMLPPQIKTAEPIGWTEHLATWDWQQGEHVTLVGPTGQGKSTLMRAILPLRDHVVFLATKPKDAIIDELEADGYAVVETWPPKTDAARIILKPRIQKASTDEQRKVIGAFLGDVYERGGYAVAVDETRYLIEFLKLERNLQLLWLQGRSMGVSIVAATQRPRHISLEAYSQATHLYAWETRDRQDIARLSEFTGHITTTELAAALAYLPRYACIYAHANGTLRATGVGFTTRPRAATT